MGEDFLAHAIKGNTIEIDRVAQFNMSKVETQQPRIIVAYAMYIGSGRVPFPSDTIDGIVMVSEHIYATVTIRHQIGQQILRALCTT